MPPPESCGGFGIGVVGAPNRFRLLHCDLVVWLEAAAAPNLADLYASVSLN